MLEGLIDEKIVQLNILAKDWIEAVNLSMEPLVQNEIVTEEYVKAVIDNAKEYGAYIVVTKHIALVHAETEKGTLKNSVGLTTLIDPVNFGNTANDPVKYLFCLSAVEQGRHLKTLSDLAVLMENKEFFDLLDTTDSVKEVIEFIINQ